MSDVKQLIRETVPHDAESAIWAFATAHLYIQVELINALLAEKAISADTLQRTLDDLRTRTHAQPPLGRAEELGRLLVPEFVEHIRRSVDWERADD